MVSKRLCWKLSDKKESLYSLATRSWNVWFALKLFPAWWLISLLVCVSVCKFHCLFVTWLFHGSAINILFFDLFVYFVVNVCLEDERWKDWKKLANCLHNYSFCCQRILFNSSKLICFHNFVQFSAFVKLFPHVFICLSESGFELQDKLLVQQFKAQSFKQQSLPQHAELQEHDSEKVLVSRNISSAIFVTICLFHLFLPTIYATPYERVQTSIKLTETKTSCCKDWKTT